MNKIFSYLNDIKIYKCFKNFWNAIEENENNKTKGLHILLFKILDETYL